MIRVQRQRAHVRENHSEVGRSVGEGHGGLKQLALASLAWGCGGPCEGYRCAPSSGRPTPGAACCSSRSPRRGIQCTAGAPGSGTVTARSST